MQVKILFLIFSFFVLASCGIHNGLTSNTNNNNTEVQLNQKNYKIIKQVQGSVSVKYIVGIGGIKKKALIAAARNEMLKEANLVGGSRAVIYETVEVHFNTVLLVYSKYTVTVSAYVIEFTE